MQSMRNKPVINGNPRGIKMTQESNDQGNGTVKILGPRAVERVVLQGLEIIAAKYRKPAKHSKEKQIYCISERADDLFLEYPTSGGIMSYSQGPSRDTKRMHPELVNYPIKIRLGNHPINTFLPIDINIRHPYWQKEAEFLIELMKEVMPECFKQSSFRIVEDFLPADKEAKLEEIAAKYRKPAEDKW